MALIETTIGVVLLAAVVIWGVLKLNKWSLNAETPEVRRWPVQFLWTIYKASLAVVILLEFGPGIADWLYKAWYFLTNYGPLW